MDRNSIIGFVLIFLILIVWNQFFFQPYVDEQNAKKTQQDSLAHVTQENVTINFHIKYQ